jgi:endonuclease III
MAKLEVFQIKELIKEIGLANTKAKPEKNGRAPVGKA